MAAAHQQVCWRSAVCTLRFVNVHESRFVIDNSCAARAVVRVTGFKRFYLSLEITSCAFFASDQREETHEGAGHGEGEAIENRMVHNCHREAQRKVEGRNFDSGKQLLEYDDVANEQLKVTLRSSATQ